MPWPAAASRMAKEVFSSHCRPKVMVPRHRRETCRPVGPKRTCCIGVSSLFLVDHLHRHAAVERQVLPGHEAGLLGDIEAGPGDVLRRADAACRVLDSVTARMRSAACFDPARAD